jgi:tRNA A-37 threonylcarbamoyl transferase component Bud32
MKTRRQMRGGRLLGEGLQGVAYDLCTSEDQESFCDTVDSLKDSLTKMTLYTTGTDRVLTSQSEMHKFASFLRGQRDKLAKTFKPGSIFSTKSTEHKCKEELEINRNILSIYKSQAGKYLTIQPLRGGILGAKIESKQHTPLFVLFGSKCDNKYSLDLPSFLKDLLESLVILQRHNSLHNDIKADNIVRCDNRYKFIDWGGMSLMKKEAEPHAKICTSPLRWYCHGYNEFISTSLLSFRAKQREYEAYKSPLFQEVHRRILSEFQTVMARGLSREALFEEYKNTFDVFMLGMTLLYLIHNKHDLHAKYVPILYKLVSLTDPPKNAKEALSLL